MKTTFTLLLLFTITSYAQEEQSDATWDETADWIKSKLVDKNLLRDNINNPKWNSLEIRTDSGDIIFVKNTKNGVIQTCNFDLKQVVENRGREFYDPQYRTLVFGFLESQSGTHDGSKRNFGQFNIYLASDALGNRMNKAFKNLSKLNLERMYEKEKF